MVSLVSLHNVNSPAGSMQTTWRWPTEALWVHPTKSMQNGGV